MKKNFIFRSLMLIFFCFVSCFLCACKNTEDYQPSDDTQQTEEHQHNYSLEELVIDHISIDNCGVFICNQCEDIVYREIGYNDVKMPILSLTGSMSGISKDNKITLSISYEGNDLSFDCDAALKWQGASSINYPKKNYNIQFLKTGTDSKNKVELNDSWGKQSKYTLKANWVDYSQSRNVVSGKIYSQIVHSRNINDEVSKIGNGGVVDGFPILIYHNGDFHGLYTLNLPKDDWMFGMEDDEEDDEIVTKHAALSTGTWENEVFLMQEIEDFSANIELEFCSTEDTIGTEWVLDSFNDMIRFINNSSDEEFKQNITNYINLERTIDSMIYTSVILAADNNAKNIIWLTYDGKHWFSSMYDMDGTWGMVWSGDFYTDVNLNIVSETSGNNLWKRIYKLYKHDIAKRYISLRMNILSTENIKKQFDSFDGSISDLIRNTDKMKWTEIPSKDVNNNEQIYDFMEKRFEYLDNLMLSYL